MTLNGEYMCAFDAIAVHHSNENIAWHTNEKGIKKSGKNERWYFIAEKVYNWDESALKRSDFFLLGLSFFHCIFVFAAIATQREKKKINNEIGLN